MCNLIYAKITVKGAIMIKAILFDLDNTLLPMDEEKFTKGYFGLLAKKLLPFGYESETLISTVWAGTKAMIKNDGTKTNEQVFWEVFEKQYGEKSIKDKKIFDEFYEKDFPQTKIYCQENPHAKDIIELVKSKNIKVILSSNPVFPKVAMLTRLSYVGLRESDFEYITSYENSCYCKPNPKYFEEILQKNNLKPDEVVFFGNSQQEDIIPASSCGIKAYLVDKNPLSYDVMKDVINSLKI